MDECGLDSPGSGCGPVFFYENGNESQGPIKDREFIHWLSDHYLLKKDSAPERSLGIQL
jgi:hypothetical protein